MDLKKRAGLGAGQAASARKKLSAKEIQQARAYFAPEGLRFLRGLARNNDREWFNQRKPVYEAEIKRPMLAVI